MVADVRHRVAGHGGAQRRRVSDTRVPSLIGRRHRTVIIGGRARRNRVEAVGCAVIVRRRRVFVRLRAARTALGCGGSCRLRYILSAVGVGRVR